MMTDSVTHSFTPAWPGDQHRAPYSEALQTLASHPWQRLHVPAHQAQGVNVPGLERLVGSGALAVDFPMLFSGIDQDTWHLVTHGRTTPIMEAQDLAAELWGAKRTWFLTNGASGINHTATGIVRALGAEVIAQRSVHSSVIDGFTHAGITPHFVQGVVDSDLGSAHGVTADQIATALHDHPNATAVLIVSPSYFGAVADVAAIAEVVHEHGIPLIVDEAWGSHFGLHRDLPTNSVRLGADLVISSTHKGIGSLTQSAMLMLGNGPHAQAIEELTERMVRSYQSTSSSSLLIASIDEARRNVAVNGDRLIGSALESANIIRSAIRASERFRDATPDILASPDAVANDPFKIVIDMRGAGITGTEAQAILIAEHRIYCELATPAALVALIGATSPADHQRFLSALHSLPMIPGERDRMLALPAPCETAMPLGQAFYSRTEIVSSTEAVGRVSADSLAAYPPGIPNVLPGEVLSAEVVHYLRATASMPSGYVRGASDSKLDTFRVVA